jgi:hypothetical protein
VTGVINVKKRVAAIQEVNLLNCLWLIWHNRYDTSDETSLG